MPDPPFQPPVATPAFDALELLENLPDGFIALDAELRFRYINAAGERINRVTREEILGRGNFEVFPEALGTPIEAAFRKTVAEREPVEFEVFLRPWRRWFAIRAFPAPDGGMCAHFRDITEAKRSQLELEASEAQFRELAESIPQLAWYANADGYITWYNRRWYEYTGTTPEEMEGWGWQRVHDPEALPLVMERWQECLRTGCPFDMTFPLRGADGAYRLFLTRIVPVRNAWGRIIQWFGTNTDITEQRRAEEALRASESRLRESETRFRTLVDGAPVAIGMSRAGRNLYVNPAHRQLFRIPPEEKIEGTAIFDEIAPEEQERMRDRVRRRYQGEAVETSYEFWAVRRDGTRFLAHINVGQIDLPDGPASLAFITDVTEARRAEEEMRLAAQRKDEFLATLAHELRNPLHPIRSAVRILAEQGPPEPLLQRQRAIVERQVGNMARLLDDLLDVSRVTRGMVKLEREPLDFTEVMEEAVDACRPVVEQKGHHLHVSLAPHPIPLVGDRLRLEQVVMNLLGNAARYTDPAGTITVETSCEGGWGVLRIRDTGRGISPDLLPHLFDLFFQAERGLTRSEGGLGIGLTLVRSLVELHGGRVQAFSAGLGQGSEFQVFLPLAREPVASSAEPVAPSAEPAPLPAAGAVRVLVVDDIPDNVETLAELLNLWGYQVRMAQSGAAALEVASAFQPDVTFLDIGMPGMDGYETARRLRANPETRETILVALTGYGQEQDRRQAEEAGFDEHLMKPADPDRIRALLESHCGALRG